MSSKWAEINCAQSREKYLTTISLSTICLEILGNSPLGKMHHHSSQVAWIGFSIFIQWAVFLKKLLTIKPVWREGVCLASLWFQEFGLVKSKSWYITFFANLDKSSLKWSKSIKPINVSHQERRQIRSLWPPSLVGLSSPLPFSIPH